MKYLLLIVMLSLTGCSSIAPKSWGNAGSTDAFRVTPPNPASGSMG